MLIVDKQNGSKCNGTPVRGGGETCPACALCQ